MNSPSNPSTSSSIADLLNGLKQVEQSGVPGADFRLSATASQQYLASIGRFRDKLNMYKTWADDLINGYGHPGNFASATQTVENLQDAVTDADNGLVPNLDGYIAYVDELENTVKAIHAQFQGEDKSSPPTHR